MKYIAQFSYCKYVGMIEIDAWRWDKLHAILFALFKVC